VRLSFERLVQTKCEARPATRSSYARAKSPLPGPFDLDHARSLVGELAGAERRGDRVLERDDGDAFERSHRVAGHQNDLGRPSTCSATYERIRLVEIGATW
jgi:hypothetical protein